MKKVVLGNSYEQLKYKMLERKREKVEKGRIRDFGTEYRFG